MHPAQYAATKIQSELLSDSWSEAEFAEQIGRKVRTLKLWRSLGKGPAFFRIGAQVRYPRDAARKWLASLVRDPDDFGDEG